MNRTTNYLFGCALALMSAGMSSAATISLDTLGADPTLTSPFFSFTTDSLGNFSAVYTNLTVPPFNFVTLEFVAPFSSAFYFGPTGPKRAGVSCDGDNAFLNCSVTFRDATTTLVFDFFGLDATHVGFPYGFNLGLSATGFEPNQVVSGGPIGAPEPGAFQLAGIGFTLCGLFMAGKKLLKLGVRS